MLFLLVVAGVFSSTHACIATATSEFEVPDAYKCDQYWEYLESKMKCYKAADGETTFDNAKAACGDGAELVSIHSDAEQDLLREMLEDMPVSLYWIGLKKATGENGLWEWEDESPYDFKTSWSTGQPDEAETKTCVMMDGLFNKDYKWFTTPCTETARPLCQKKAEIIEDGNTCYSDWDFFASKKSCYQQITSTTTVAFEQAKEACKSLDANLVSIDTEEENAFVAGTLQSTQWIGLTKSVASPLTWVDGTTITESNAMAYKEFDFADLMDANGMCFVMQDNTDHSWKDVQCDDNTVMAYTCEYDAPVKFISS